MQHAEQLSKDKTDRAAAAAAVAKLQAKVAVPGATSLRDIPGGVDHKAAGGAQDWKTKEKLKRDRGQVSRGGSYEQEEKRILRQYDASG